MLVESLLTEEDNNNLLQLIKDKFHSMKIVRGGSVAIEKG